MKSKGFTLLEITVVISIIILLSGIFLVNYRQGEKEFALQRSAHSLAQTLRKTQEMAMSSKLTPVELFGGTFPKGGYGLYFEKNSNTFILFADCDNEGDYDDSGYADCKTADVGSENSLNEKIEEFSFEEGIYISDLIPSGGNTLIIKFFPPDPIITAIPDDPSPSITLSFGGQSTKRVVINKSGLIDVE